MKSIRLVLYKILLSALILTGFFGIATAQDLEPAKVKEMVNSHRFLFKANTVLPQTGGSRQLTSQYDVLLTKDSVVSFLPYFGRSYAAIIGEDAGIKFTSTVFDYKAKQGKKGKWQISVKPKDTREVRELIFDVSDNGYTYLQVISNSRQNIGFWGYLQERR